MNCFLREKKYIINIYNYFHERRKREGQERRKREGHVSIIFLKLFSYGKEMNYFQERRRREGHTERSF